MMGEAEQHGSEEKWHRHKPAQRNGHEFFASNKPINERTIKHFLQWWHHEGRADNACRDKKYCKWSVCFKLSKGIPGMTAYPIDDVAFNQASFLQCWANKRRVNSIKSRIKRVQSNPHCKNNNADEHSRSRKFPLNLGNVAYD